MRYFVRLILSSLILLVAGTSNVGLAQHENQSYLPIERQSLNRRFVLKSLRDIKLDEISSLKTRAGWSGAEIKVEPHRSLQVTGKDKGGKSWTVHFGASCSDIRSYEGDLDRNGLRDLLFLIPTCGNGLAPSSHIITLMFDQQGRPIPFEADGYFMCTDDGIADIVDMDRNQRAELIYMNFDDGYWITNLYRATNAKWERVEGYFGKYRFPLFVRFTLKENHRSTTPKPGRRPFAPDLSNAVSRVKGRLHSYEWPDVYQSKDFGMVIEDVDGKKIECRPDSWYSSFSVVVDKKDGRSIAFVSAHENRLKPLLEKIRSDRSAVALYGNRRTGRCSPEIIWAHSR